MSNAHGFAALFGEDLHVLLHVSLDIWGQPESEEVVEFTVFARYRLQIQLAKVHSVARSLLDEQSRVVVFYLLVDRFENHFFDCDLVLKKRDIYLVSKLNERWRIRENMWIWEVLPLLTRCLMGFVCFLNRLAMLAVEEAVFCSTFSRIWSLRTAGRLVRFDSVFSLTSSIFIEYFY